VPVTTATPESPDCGWEDGYQRLLAYVDEHGHARVPTNYKTDDDDRLGRWVATQRGSYKDASLSPDRIRRLEAVKGWAWDMGAAEWEESFAALKAYIVEHGHAQPPTDYSTSEGFDLGRWVVRQRLAHKRRDIAQDHKDRLGEISEWTWNPGQSRWERGFEALNKYIDEFNEAEVPTDYVNGLGYQLGSWTALQKRLAGLDQLSGDRRRLLESIGVDWPVSLAEPPSPSPDTKGLEELKRYGETIEWIPHPFETVIVGVSERRVNGGVRDSEEGMVVPEGHGPPSCYLNDSGFASLTVDSGPHLGMRQLRLNPEVTSPEFFVEWVNNSRVGQLTLAAVGKGGDELRINEETLCQIPIYLPTLKEQRKILAKATGLEGVLAEVEQRLAVLWSGSQPADSVRDIGTRRGGSAKQDVTIEAWIRSLPYPLASILSLAERRALSDRDRNDYLFRFYETLAAFFGIIQLSAFRSSPRAWATYGPVLENALKRQSLEDAPSFGTWNTLNDVLSARFKRFKDDQEVNQLRSSIYGTSDEAVLTMLGDPRIRGVVNQVSKLRNDFPGHGGLTDEGQDRVVREELDRHLGTVRAAVGMTWEKYELVQAGSSELIGDARIYDVELIRGPDRTFERARRQANAIFQSGSLVLYDAIAQTTLELLPLLRIRPAPETRMPACYIYNGRDGDARKFKSNEFSREGNISEVVHEIDHMFEHLFVFPDRPDA
tara:strand:- start:3325 stop:5472 length:2148 start_codon:yes stop_codon:yes gene_type:complete